MLHEIIKFLTYKDIYNRYSGYNLKELVASNTVLRAVYETIRDLHETSGENNLTLEEIALLAQDKVRPADKGDLDEYVKSLVDIDRTRYSDESIRRAFEAAYKRNVAVYLAAVTLPVLNGAEDLDIPDILNKLESSSNLISARDNEVEYSTYIETEPVRIATIPTYIETLDQAIEGGLSPGQLATYVGWPGIGKTLLLHQSAALSYFHGYHAALITLEINKAETCKRLDMFFGRYSSPERFNDLRNAAKERGGRLTVLDGADDIFTPASVRSFLEAQRRKGRVVDVLFIDYADLMETGRNLEDYNELGEIYRQLRRIGNKFNVPIWTASQAIRGAINKRWLGMGDIADSFKKARIADLIVTINQDENEQEAGDIRLYVAKSRRNKGHPKVFLKTDMDRMAVVPK